MDRQAWIDGRHAVVVAEYDAEAATYDESPYPNDMQQIWVQRLIDTCPPDGTILDAPCGTGRYFSQIAAAGRRVFGIDQSSRMLEQARARDIAIDLRHVGLQELAFAGRFDAVMTIDAMENVAPEDWPLVLANLHRAVRPGGHLYLTVEEQPHDKVAAEYEHLIAADIPAVIGEVAHGDVAGYHFYPGRDRVIDWINNEGLQIIDEDVVDHDGWRIAISFSDRLPDKVSDKSKPDLSMTMGPEDTRKESSMALSLIRIRRVAATLAASAVLDGVITMAPIADTASAQAPSIVATWNSHALDTLTNAPTADPTGAGQTPPVSLIHLAMVHGAIYDAVNAITGGYQPYLDGLDPAPPTASQEAAVATAAHHVLVGLGIGLVPALPQPVRDRLDSLYASSLAVVAEGPAKDAGIAAGADAAAAMLAARTNDGRYVPFAHPEGMRPGQWRPTPPANTKDPFAWVARVEPFTLTSTSQFRTRGPRDLRSGVYAREYNEVKELGSLDTPANPSPRTPAQTAVATFYVANGVPMFYRTFRALAEENLSIADEARLFAQLSIAGADSVINCWDDKAFWSFWRPITAIQNGDADESRRTDGDAAWVPMFATPPYPDHPSGYNCISGAMMNTGKYFFGTDRMEFDVTRIVPGEATVTRHYDRFTDLLDDTIDACVFWDSTSGPPTCKAPGSAGTSPTGSTDTSSSQSADATLAPSLANR